MNKSFRSILSIILCAVIALTVSVTAFASELTGSGTATDPYKISTAADLDELSARVAAGDSFAGKFFILTDSFAVSSSFNPIGTKTSPFKGTFDGNGQTLSRFNVRKDNAGLFAYLSGATVKNLTVSGYFKATGYAGAIASYAESATITGCTCTASVYADNYAGGIVGYIADGIIDNCKTSNRATIGGYVEYCGGMAGFSGADITNCVNNGYVFGEKSTGGIAGTSTGSIVSCTNTALVEGGDPNLGGIAGLTEGTVKYCKNTGRIATTDSDVGNVGGIVGVGYKADIAECISAGAVAATANYAGGIAGYLTAGSVTNCVAAANVSTTKNYAGGIFGYSASTAVSKCIFTAFVSTNASSATDGAIGAVSGGTVTDCYYNSDNETRVLYTGKATNTTGITSGAVLNKDSFAALDFKNVWDISSFHASYPLLRNIPFHSLTTDSVTTASCTVDGVKTETCSQCKEVIKTITPAYGHSFKVVSSKAATCTEAGYEDKLCSTCKATDSTVYPAKGHTDANNDSICDVCNSSTKLEADKGGLLQKIADFFNKIIQWIINLFS